MKPHRLVRLLPMTLGVGAVFGVFTPPVAAQGDGFLFRRPVVGLSLSVGYALPRAGSDVFVVSEGKGSDLIVDFQAADVVRIGGYGFTSFDAVKAKMVQSGANVRLNLSGDEFLVFANMTIAELSTGDNSRDRSFHHSSSSNISPDTSPGGGGTSSPTRTAIVR